MKYYLIGTLPPPLGGVSVFVYRFKALLEAQGQPVQVVDFGRHTRLQRGVQLLKFICDPRPAVFHLNNYDLYILLALALRPFAGRYEFHDHSGRMVRSFRGIRRWVFQRYLNRLERCTLVGEHIRGDYQAAGFRLPPNVQVQNAFLPPPPEDEARIWASYTPETLAFIASHRPLIVANAFQITFYQGVDLYGIDMCIELAAALKAEYPQAGLLFALAEVGDPAYFARLKQLIQEKGCAENFHFMTGQKELWPLFKKADLMLRPTFADGFGISVAEALHFGCPAIASDVCERAEGTILFQNRNQTDLHAKVRQVLQKTPAQERKA